MPVGSWPIYPKVIQSVLATNPQTILDLGIGYGMNGAGIRNWYNNECELIGVEGFGGYKNPMWEMYNDVIVNDIERTLSNYIAFEQFFDMVIMTDVLEHFDKLDGKMIIEMILFITKKSALITTPGVWFEQGPENGNEYERHRSLWTVTELKEMGFGIVSTDHNMIVADMIKK